MPDQTFSTFLPFSKVDEQSDGTLMVWGRATHEIVDSANEIMDYASSAPLFQRRSQENSDRSEGHNLMPLRSMHQNGIAAGKVVQFDYKDNEKAIDIGAMVVDPVEVLKVKNHVYTGFSVGGKYARRWPDNGSVRFTADPREISLVDAPAVPTAKFTLFKVDGEDTDLPEFEPAWVAEFKSAVVDMKKIKQEEEDKKNILLTKLKSIGESVGILHRDISPLTAPNTYPESSYEYGDPANWAYPVTELHKGLTIDRFNENTDGDKYSQKERHILGRRISIMASKFGKYKYDPITSHIYQEENIMTDDFTKLDVGAVVAGLKSLGAQSSALASTDPNAALAMLLGHIDSLSTGSPVSGHTVPVNDPSVSMGKAVAPGTSPSATAQTTTDETDTSTSPSVPSTTTSTSTPVKKAGAVVIKPHPKAKVEIATKPTSEDTESSTEESTEDESSKPTKMFKMLEDKVNALADNVSVLVNALTKSVQARQDEGSPVGALNAMVKANVAPMADDPIIKALDEGGPYALLKALKAAGADGEDGALAWQNMNNAIRRATYENLEKGGVVTASRYIGRTYSAQ